MGQKMKNPPIYFALAQVRFNAVLALDRFMPTIQENLRKAGFPDFAPQVVATLNVNLTGGKSSALPAFQPQTRYQILNIDKTAGFVLEQNSMSFQTTEYDDFERFLAAMMQGVDIVHSAAELSYYERVGIRFLDAVCPREGDNIEQYLDHSVLGLLGKLKGRKLSYAISETQTQGDENTLMSRVAVMQQDEEGVAFPPDLQNPVLPPPSRFSKVTGLYAVLDNDCWVAVRSPFDPSTLEKQLQKLHTEIRKSFDFMVTPHALSVWE